MMIVIALAVFVIFIYTAGFAVKLWKEKNKPGSIAIFLLAIGIVVTPFFSVL
ncbi:hypothetical protein [Virgibacillus sp. YIM 98842]|jgi:uncharacterized membrane protein (DUF485 family)|uniref:hypothetical protein n=1 Tax=Virgibacillus sp. YIM 98842 TaxID=2663533 RepID=UPI0013DD3AD4|nr:hypothetical protein [Virgibacillus sp. YIM 98842]